MFKNILWVLLAAYAGSSFAAERKFDFSESPENQAPTNCQSVVSGAGKPGNWKVIMADIPLALPALTPQGSNTGKKAAVAQLAEDMTDEHFPMLVLGNDTYNDFTFSTRFKLVSGIFEQMAGIAFRMQDEKNYYVLRVSGLGNNVRFYKVINGERGNIIGPDAAITKDTWHELAVECKGNQIRCLLDGKEIIPMLTDNSLGAGKIALWTKSDSVSYFTDTQITYTPRERFLQTLVRESMQKYPRLQGMQIATLDKSAPRLVASTNEKEIGQPGEKNDIDVINKGVMTYRKDNDVVYVTLPLRDRNGDPAAAVRLAMKSFAGQTQENALVRAMPIVKQMQARVPAVNDLRE